MGKRIVLSLREYPEDIFHERHFPYHLELRKSEISEAIEVMRKQIYLIEDKLRGKVIPGKMSDAEFMSASEKEKVIKQWASFIKSGFRFDMFTENLYKHLHLHCGYIAHYDKSGYYYTYWNDEVIRYARGNGNDTGPTPKTFYEWESFLDQFTIWGDYYDINVMMMRTLHDGLSKVVSMLLNEAREIYRFEAQNAHMLMLKDAEDLRKEIEELEDEVEDKKKKLSHITAESYLKQLNDDFETLFGSDVFITEETPQEQIQLAMAM